MNRGSLINDDIHELELELELLKRKRLMVQQQQTLLASQQNYSQTRQPGFDYQQSSQQFNQQTNRRYDISQEHNQARNFSHLYDGPNQQHGLKRHAPDSSFHTNPPAKRFNGPQGGKPNKGPKGLPKPWDVDPINRLQTMQRSINQPQPLLSFETFKKKLNFNPSMSRPAHSDFKPNKVTKPNVDNTPKYKSNPVPATRKAPATRNKPVAQSSEATKKSHYEYVLRANDTPDNLVNGRMEFAMGHILKEIRGTFGDVKKYSHIFTTAPQKETIKKILRERIRCAMLDKVVGPGKDIIIEYRKMFPQHTDKEILELTLLASKAAKIPQLCIQLEDADNPKNYFTNNFNKLLDVELDKMFEKIKNLYKDENKVNTKSMQEIINDNIPTPVHVEISKTDDNASESGFKTTSNDEPEPIKEPATEDSKPPSDVTNADEQQDDTKTKETKSTAIIDETKPPNDIDFAMFCAWKHYNSKFFQSEFYDKLIIFGIKQRLHELLPRKRHNIMAMFELDNMYTAAKEEIIKNTMKKLDSSLNKNAGEPEIAAAAAEETTKPMDVSKYFVRVAGRPHLPKKKFMKEFLDKFNPTSIKKHRQLSYLLFVGFSKKEDYEKLLQANGTLINGDQVQAGGPADALTLCIEEVANGEPEDYKAVLPEPDPRYKAVLQEPDSRPFENAPIASNALNVKDALDISIDEKAQPEFVDASHTAVPGGILACTNEVKVTKKRGKRGGKLKASSRRERKRKLEERRNRACEKDKPEDGDQVQAEGPTDVLTLSIEEVASGEPEDYKVELPEPDPRSFEDISTASSVNIKEASDISIDEKAQDEFVDPSRPAVLEDIQACTIEGTVTKKRKWRGDPNIRTRRRKERRKRMEEKRKSGCEKDRSEENSRLLMTASDVSQSAKPCTDTNIDDDVILVGENKSLDNSSDVSNIISSDLDEQITDLLSSIRKAEETQSANEEKDETVAETPESEVINLTDDTSSIKEDSENAPAAESQMETDDVIQERMAPGADEEATKIHGDKLSVETKVTTESNENQNDDLNTNKQDKSDNTTPDETKNEEANNASPAESKENTNNTETENKQFVEEENIEMNKVTNKTEEVNNPTVTEEITEPKKDRNETEEINKPTAMEEVIEIEDNDEEKTRIENKTIATVKDTTKGTPVRASSRLANSMPSRVTTRRTSKLAQQNNQ